MMGDPVCCRRTVQLVANYCACQGVVVVMMGSVETEGSEQLHCWLSRLVGLDTVLRPAQTGLMGLED
ncbi:hypothetical protein ACOMHN_052453 [Nucella lapillus]